MSPLNLTLIITAALIGGVCLTFLFRYLPIALRSNKDFKAWSDSPGAQYQEQIAQDNRARARLSWPMGRRRWSSICGVVGNLLRHTDGSYTKGYKIPLSPSMYLEEEIIENKMDEISRLLAVEKPPGTIIQTRLNVTPDSGRVIRQHINSRSEAATHPLAGLLHASSIGFYQEACNQGLFKDMMLSMWVKVPTKHPRDRRGLGLYLSTLTQEIRRRGLARTLLPTFRAAADRMSVRRTVEDEGEAREKAEKTFRLIEAQCPVELSPTPFNRKDLWEAVFRNQRQNSRSVPFLPETPGLDVRDYLCSESIEGTGWFLLHGSCPVAVVSMFVPPNPGITSDTTRLLTANPTLNFRHTIITDFLSLDERKAKGRLTSRINHIERTTNTLWGRRELKHDARAAKNDLDRLLNHVEEGRETLVVTRFYAIIYSEEARTREELIASVKNLDLYCEQFIAAVRRIPGADADREEPAALRAIYQQALIGETTEKPIGRELIETADSMACLIPSEGAWTGSPRPHTILTTPSGQMTALDLYDRSLIKSPTVIITAASGEGKSVMGARIINDILDHKANLRVKAADYGGSLRPLTEILHGREIRFDGQEKRAINSWSFPGIELGEDPSPMQEGFVIGDILNMAQVSSSDRITYSVVTTIVREVYKINKARNGPGRPRFEPRLSHFLDLLRRYQWGDKASEASATAATLYTNLNIYRNNPWLDAETHPDFDRDSPFDVYAIETLSGLDEPIRDALAYRIAMQIMRSIGQKLPDGTHMPLLLVFDELHEIIKRYPRILEVIEHATRMGRKEGVVTLLMSQAYEDFVGTAERPNPIATALVKNSGVKIIGKQIGGFDRLAHDCELAPAAISAIKSIKNVTGSHSQWLTVIGSGSDKIVEKTQLNLSPSELWTFTTDTNEKDARVMVDNLRTDWPRAVVVAALAEVYPRGLTNANLTRIDPQLFEEWRMAA